jgi:hypothetical protein
MEQPSPKKRKRGQVAADQADGPLWYSWNRLGDASRRKGNIARLLKSTPRGWFRWAVGFAQSCVTEFSADERQAHTFDLVQFAYLSLGVNLRIDRPASNKEIGQWVLVGSGNWNGRALAVRIPVTRREMERTKAALASLFQRFVARQNIEYPRVTHRAHWHPTQQRYVAQMSWTDLALSHFWELASLYHHTLRLCEARATTSLQRSCETWFVPMPGSPGRYCSYTCQSRQTTRRMRTKRT